MFTKLQRPLLTCHTRFLLFLCCTLMVVLSSSAMTVEEIARKLEQKDNYLLSTENKFKAFMENYSKNYTTREEYLRRLGIFADNIVTALRHQVLDPSAAHGVTQFSDLTQTEFLRLYTHGLVSERENENKFTADRMAPPLKVEGLPENFDWREKGAVTEVKTQGMCGACWAFSTTGTLEGAHFIATGKLLNLSEQQLIDCDNKCDITDKTACDNGCQGGLMTNAYNYLMEAGGVEEEATYPYTQNRGECKFDKNKIVVRVSNFTNIPADDDQIAAYLVKQGPLAIYMQTYIGGVSCPFICGKKPNHGGLLVGYGTKGFSILRLGNKPYWIIKNSWGKRWGEHGYFKICRGYNMCGVNTLVSTAMVSH
ncbi:probable cysteine protease RD19D isoform X2 [Arachis ipaensis]|uniref:Cysteine proteinase n=1 Tax=Arachis hypogaea TaxID=3818 RepID=A0A6B9VB67_ARAHY|nr:probable cysteine protease RD19D isoform X2 [Arachis ipaensis]XP_025676489.1 probable cysteine protease RD19D isoform X2 [Arachis hypogaea]QHN78799.1 Cysteine proteinase [Arachis hypogaea]